jgi:hypothetical protein
VQNEAHAFLLMPALRLRARTHASFIFSPRRVMPFEMRSAAR